MERYDSDQDEFKLNARVKVSGGKKGCGESSERTRGGRRSFWAGKHTCATCGGANSSLEWYSSFRVWPESIRTPLKKAIKARNHGDTDKAEKYFFEALAAAHALPPADLEPQPLQKLTGLYITLAAMLEPIQPIRAFAALRDAYALFGADALTPGAVSPYTGAPMSQEDLTRAIGLAQKMGQLAARLGAMTSPPPFPAAGVSVRERIEMANVGAEGEVVSPAAQLLKDSKMAGGEGAKGGKEARMAWDTAAEEYLGAAIGAMLKLGLQHRQAAAATAAGPQAGAEGGAAPAGAAVPGSGTSDPVIVGRDVRLPHDNVPGEEGDTSGRVNRRGLGMTMEALAEVYGRRGRPDLAGQLVLQAITTVLPPQAEPGSILPADQCQGES